MVLGLAFSAILTAAETPKEYTGVVHDNSRTVATPARQCVVIKGPKYTLQTDDGAWIIADEKLVAPYAGKRVSITGVIRGGNKLHIRSIVPAQPAAARK